MAHDHIDWPQLRRKTKERLQQYYPGLLEQWKRENPNFSEDEILDRVSIVV
jgi:hypothetical protein